MKSKLSVCVVTGSRADYSHLFYPIKCLQESKHIDLKLVVTGMHLSSEFGNTVELIKNDGFCISKEVPSLIVGSDPVSVTKSIGKGMIEFADVFNDIKPDLLMVLGDRFEILPVVQAALIAKIPVAHIAGGDVTEGAFDDAIRHSITKMSHIHFVTNEESKKRVLQMGENPKNVHLVGATSLDIINNFEFMSKDDFLSSVGLGKKYSKYILLTYHPETMSENSTEQDIDVVIKSIAEFKDVGVIITGANADTGGGEINDILKKYADENENVVFYMSLGKDRFYNALYHVDVFVGNSSSGLYEAPSFKLPVVNIGDRQKNRLSADSVINCTLKKEKIISAIGDAFIMDCTNVVSPYGDGTASKKIVKILEKINNPKKLLHKKFFNYGENNV